MNKAINFERWSDIKSYEGMYLISDHGRVLSLSRKIKRKCGDYISKTFELKQSMSTTGYYKVDLKRNGIREIFKVHRLVATYFVANPYEYGQVNHIDGNPLNNHFSNLEWVTQQQNAQHAVMVGLKSAFDIDKSSLEYLHKQRGMNAKEIGELFGLSSAPILKKLKEYGIEVVNQNRYGLTEKFIADELEKGRTQKDIAKEVGCDPSLISHYKSRIEKGESIYAQ